MKSYYEILEINPTLNIAAIRKAFRAMIMEHHPDKQGDLEKSQEVIEAWKFLADETQRQYYFESLSNGQPFVNNPPNASSGSQAFYAKAEEDAVVRTGDFIRLYIPLFISKTERIFLQGATIFDEECIKDDKDIDETSKNFNPIIHPLRLSKNPVDFSAVATIVNNALKQNSFLQVGLDMCELSSIVNQHSWYKRSNGFLGIEVNVLVQDINSRMTESEHYGPNILNANAFNAFLSLKLNSFIDCKNIVALHLDTNYSLYKIPKIITALMPAEILPEIVESKHSIVLFKPAIIEQPILVATADHQPVSCRIL